MYTTIIDWVPHATVHRDQPNITNRVRPVYYSTLPHFREITALSERAILHCQPQELEYFCHQQGDRMAYSLSEHINSTETSGAIAHALHQINRNMASHFRDLDRQNYDEQLRSAHIGLPEGRSVEEMLAMLTPRAN